MEWLLLLSVMLTEGGKRAATLWKIAEGLLSLHRQIFAAKSFSARIDAAAVCTPQAPWDRMLDKGERGCSLLHFFKFSEVEMLSQRRRLASA